MAAAAPPAAATAAGAGAERRRSAVAAATAAASATQGTAPPAATVPATGAAGYPRQRRCLFPAQLCRHSHRLARRACLYPARSLPLPTMRAGLAAAKGEQLVSGLCSRRARRHCLQLPRGCLRRRWWLCGAAGLWRCDVASLVAWCQPVVVWPSRSLEWPGPMEA